MKFVSWNVNGLRACIGKGFTEFFRTCGADVFCVQETKMQQGQAELSLPGYEQYWNSAVKKGYSGTAVFTAKRPLSVSYDIGIAEHGDEGRAITLEFADFFLVNVYTPNSQKELTRLDYRMLWENDFRAYLLRLDAIKPVVVCGDMNVAHHEIDLKNPKSNIGSAGFTPEEREKMSELLGAGFVDTFRSLYPNRAGAYTWWSYLYSARSHNAGWRIDYFLVSERLRAFVNDAVIYSDVPGSDHCPVGLDLF
ncbi:MAG: exodeoxyribonuclease III [Clostridia bacterium]|nr:exodeoxyribonuclease III [Clostridia bacterium]MDR3645621.1 exodeoxyribonuclease III [Clostridia bacterium]